MSANAQGFDFDEYDKPGTERLRKRRGDDDLGSDLEEDLLEEDWLSGKKNPSEMSDEELNDDLLQSDDEEQHDTCGQGASLNATYSLGTSYDHQENLQEANYTDDAVDLGEEDVEDGYQQEGEEEFTGDLIQDQDGYQDEVLDIEINEPLESEFPDDHKTSYRDGPPDEHGAQQYGAPEGGKNELGGGEQPAEPEDSFASSSRVFDTDELDNEVVPDIKEESEEEDEEDEDSCRSRFKTERKYSGVVRMGAATDKRRDIPETLELSEKAQQDLMDNRQNRFGGRGQGYGRGRRGRGFHQGYRMPNDYRGGYHGRMHDRIHPLMGLQKHPSRMAHLHPPHHQQLQSQQHHISRPRGPSSFQELGHPLAQQPLQPLISPRMSHRSPPLRPKLEGSPRMMSPPPPNFSHHHPQQPQQPKNIHINPHFRGPAPPPVQVPLMPPAQSQPRPAVGPQRFPGLGDFHQNMPGNFSQPQRLPHHMEPFRNQPHLGPQDREGLFIGDHPDSSLYPGQHLYDHHNNIHQQQHLPGQGPIGFGPPGPGFNQQGLPGMFAREPQRPNLPPHQSHQGIMGLNQQGQPRPFMSPRQPFGQQGNIFPPSQGSFGMQVRHVRPMMHGPPGPQLLHQDSMQSHPSMQHEQHQQHHRQEMPHHHQQLNHNEPHPAMHHGQNPFDQQQTHSSLRQISPRPQNLQQRNMSKRQRMSTPVSKQMHPQRNSNLRELPVAPDNTNNGSSRPTATNVRPVSKATQGMHQNTRLAPGGGREHATVFAKTASQPEGAGRIVIKSEFPTPPVCVIKQDPDEDEETRQYRLKIEEQKRLREEILKKKEMRRQIQAGVRKKELLERMNSQSNAATQSPAQIMPQHNLPTSHPGPEPPQQHNQRPQFQTQQQRQFPQRAQQPFNQLPDNSILGNPFPPNGAAQLNMPPPYMKVRQEVQPQQTPRPSPQQLLSQQNQQQQRRNVSALLSPNKLNNQPQLTNIPQRNTLLSPAGVATQTQELKPGAKRTVMQRVKVPNEAQPIPQKIRVVKLSAGADSAGVTSQSVTSSANTVNQGVQRTVTMMGQQDPAGGPQGGHGTLPQNRVVVSGRGRGRGGGQRGRGRGITATPHQTGHENKGGNQTPATGLRSVSIQGLSLSITDNQLRTLLRSVGPIEMCKMIPQQRKAIATFVNPQHAVNFQTSFHRRMIDLSHIDVSLIN